MRRRGPWDRGGFLLRRGRRRSLATPPGETLAVLRYERQTADRAFDPEGERVALPARRDESLSLFVEHGLTRRLTLQAKLGVTRGHDSAVGYDGRGPTELGLRCAVLRTDRSVFSLYAGPSRAGWAATPATPRREGGSFDVELRALAGRSGVWRARPAFAELQGARRSLVRKAPSRADLCSQCGENCRS